MPDDTKQTLYKEKLIMKIMANSEYLDRLKPIKEYELISGEKLIVLDEKFSVGDDGFVGFGYIDDGIDTVYPALFSYNLENGKVTGLYGIANGIILEIVAGKLVTHAIATQN